MYGDEKTYTGFGCITQVIPLYTVCGELMPRGVSRADVSRITRLFRLWPVHPARTAGIANWQRL